MIVLAGLRPLISVTLSSVSPSPSIRGRGNIERGALPLLNTPKQSYVEAKIRK